ncbi:hypothetical protein N7532_001269 [Penicillium argentinense]|uniref:Cysteine protease n=1 Tax=Penicillium argentinense TaxID=1131581 RepID=A0A9W9G262_9EURO|nr:uncharacterized protein N7532_001269 [Penicillium argentinense]KAJ5110734.1 hypothetical protein N7532_001269 [Penicillium argentinense]
MAGVDLEKCKRIVQYFWDPEPKNDTVPEASIWCLGREYTVTPPETEPSAGESQIATSQGRAANSFLPLCTKEAKNTTIEGPKSPNEGIANTWPEEFLDDFESRIWMTYRSHFTPIPRNNTPEAASSMTLGVRLRSQLMEPQGFTSDTGWGCMIRSGQSLLANALSTLRLGRDWRRGHWPEEESKLLAMFADHPDSPFSIHRFVQRGAESCGKYPGEWFGPSATARCIQMLSNECESPKLRVYVTNNTSDVYEAQVAGLGRDETGQIMPVLILLGLRLGIEHVTSVYWDGLRAALQYPQSVGIAGGRPSASHYFVGVQDSHMFFLDPHTTRPALPAPQTNKVFSPEQLDSYHTRRLRRIHIKDMDPSMLIGFLIRDQEDWEDWKQRVQNSPGKPIIHVLADEKQTDQSHERLEALDEVEALDDSDSAE